MLGLGVAHGAAGRLPVAALLHAVAVVALHEGVGPGLLQVGTPQVDVAVQAGGAICVGLGGRKASQQQKECCQGPSRVNRVVVGHLRDGL